MTAAIARKTSRPKGAIHCLAGPDARFGILCKRRGQHTSVARKAEFAKMADDLRCIQCAAQLTK